MLQAYLSLSNTQLMDEEAEDTSQPFIARKDLKEEVIYNSYFELSMKPLFAYSLMFTFPSSINISSFVLVSCMPFVRSFMIYNHYLDEDLAPSLEGTGKHFRGPKFSNDYF